MDDKFWAQYLPVLGAGVGFGLVSGWAVGYLAKKVMLLLALAVGLVFVVIQVMVVSKLLSVNWHGVSVSFTRLTHHVQGGHSAMWSVLVYNFPYAGAFAVGFALGFKKG